MPLSAQVFAKNLKPGKKYMIEIQWNITNDLRMPKTYSMMGTYVQADFVRGRTQSFDSGLKVLRTKSRYETTFNVEGKEITVSSVNKFYEVIEPEPEPFAAAAALYALPLPNDLKKFIGTYVPEIMALKYRRNLTNLSIQTS